MYVAASDYLGQLPEGVSSALVSRAGHPLDRGSLPYQKHPVSCRKCDIFRDASRPRRYGENALGLLENPGEHVGRAGRQPYIPRHLTKTRNNKGV